MTEAQISCPTCQRQFPPASANPIKLRDDPAQAAPAMPPRSESQRIEDMAQSFGTFALLCLIGGGIAVFLGIVSIVGSAGGSSNASESGALYWVAAGALFSMAVSLFLISQIIHIRALLARKP